MGRTRENKAAIVTELKDALSEAQLALVIDYQGLSVAEITELRSRLRQADGICKVTKNTLMQLAVEEDENWQPMSQFLTGTSAFLLVKDDIGGVVRAYQGFRKDTKKTEFRGGVMQGQALNEDQVKAIADLPSKEELIAQVAGAINAVASKLAIGINEVPTSVGRGINEVPNSVGRVVAAIAAKEEGSES
ncbi:50S ribosomal protein L10 [Myxosarcina sp. GI1]|uniref:50S ribosomal protein L10 n=1 Tax=Myxosarcina sp. GI1 TaxID=1541065 RepID=UPI000566DE9D